MDPREALGRLAAGCIDPGRIPGGGQFHGLTPEDVAAAMAGLDRETTLLLRAKYAGDDSVLPELEHLAVWASMDLARRWRADSVRMRALIRLALDHVIRPQTCPKCEGRGTRIRRVIELCPKCGGTGRWELAEAEKARQVDIDPTRWHRLWRSRWADIVSLLQHWEYTGLIVMRERLG
jgi:uncharacterized phage protein